MNDSIKFSENIQTKNGSFFHTDENDTRKVDSKKWLQY